MEHEEVLGRLDAFIDGALPPGERQDVEDHLRGCVPCAEVAADTRKLLERTRSLPRTLDPSRDLWPEVRARLDRRGSGGREGRTGTWWRPALAVAATLAVVLTTVRLAGWTDREDRPSLGGTDAAAAPRTLSPSTNNVLAALDLETKAAGRSLGAALAGGSSLGPEEGAAITEGLNSLALAIAECRMALAEEPDNPRLILRLTTYYRERLELLDKATRLARA